MKTNIISAKGSGWLSAKGSFYHWILGASEESLSYWNSQFFQRGSKILGSSAVDDKMFLESRASSILGTLT